MKTTKKHNLVRRDEFRVADWLRAHAPQLHELTLVEAAAQASQELGIEVTPIHVRNIIKDLGLSSKFKIVRGTGRVVGKGIKARVNRLETLVTALYEKLGEPLPANNELRGGE